VLIHQGASIALALFVSKHFNGEIGGISARSEYSAHVSVMHPFGPKIPFDKPFQITHDFFTVWVGTSKNHPKKRGHSDEIKVSTHPSIIRSSSRLFRHLGRPNQRRR
jgi:hypothetical protein